MKKMIIVFVFYFLLIVDNFTIAQEGWFIQTCPVITDLSSVYFLNDNTGYVVGSQGVILKTTNGGNNWIQQQIASTGLLSVYFINYYTGWAVGYSGIKIKTTNGGNNWVSLVNSPYVMSSVFFLDSLYGFAAGGWNHGLIEKTTDGGITWITSYISSGINNLNSIYFINKNTGFSVGWYRYPNVNSPVLKTTNGGATWSYKNSNDASQYYYVQFTSQDTGYITTSSNYILKSTNMGENWFQINLGFSNYAMTAYFIDNNTGYVVQSNSYSAYKTTNGGYNWIAQPIQANFPEAIFFSSSNTGYIVGGSGSGTILKTTNGGVYIQAISYNVPERVSLSQNYPNPFNPATNIKFKIKELAFTALKIYDALGREVQTLVNEKLKPGEYEVTFDGSTFSSGVYFYKLQAGDFTETKKMLLIK